MIKLCIIDDDQRLANQIRKELMEFSELEWIKTCKSGFEYVKELKEMPADQHPDCILMDISMTSPDEGIQVTRLLNKLYPHVKVIMFTISDDDDRVFEAF